MDLLSLIGMLGGAARRAELIRHVGRGEWAAALSAGQIVRRARGVYALPGTPGDVVTAVSLGGVLSCCSAARYHGFEVLEQSGRPHITLPRNSGRAALDAGEGVVIHRADVPADARMTTAARTLADCARCLPVGQSLVVIDSGLRKGIGRDEVARHLNGPGSARAKWVLGLADARSGSAVETVARLKMTLAGIQDIEPQAHIDGVGWVDFLVGGWLVVEIDGFAFHSNRAEYRNDRRRANVLAVAGYVLLRFSYEDVRYRCDALIRTVEDAIAKRKRTQS